MLRASHENISLLQTSGGWLSSFATLSRHLLTKREQYSRGCTTTLTTMSIPSSVEPYRPPPQKRPSRAAWPCAKDMQDFSLLSLSRLVSKRSLSQETAKAMGTRRWNLANVAQRLTQTTPGMLYALITANGSSSTLAGAPDILGVK